MSGKRTLGKLERGREGRRYVREGSWKVGKEVLGKAVVSRKVSDARESEEV